MQEEKAGSKQEQELREIASVEDESNGLPVESHGDTASNQNEIAALAFRLWLERGCPAGSPEEDWYSAERELRRAGTPTVAPE